MGAAEAREAYKENLEAIKGFYGELGRSIRKMQANTGSSSTSDGARATSRSDSRTRSARRLSRRLKAAKPLFNVAVRLVDAFNGLPGPVKTATLAFLALAAAADPLLYFFGTMATVGGALEGARVPRSPIFAVTGPAAAATTALGQTQLPPIQTPSQQQKPASLEPPPANSSRCDLSESWCARHLCRVAH